MRFTIEELRQRYAEITDEELLALDPEDFADEARTVIEEELAKRGFVAIEDGEEGLAEGEEPGEYEEEGAYVAVATSLDLSEVRIVHALLVAAGVPAKIGVPEEARARGVDVDPRLYVPLELAAAANDILAEDVPEEEMPASAEEE